MGSKFLKLSAKDFIKGLIVAMITTLITGIYQVIQSGGSFDWVTLKPVVIAAIGAGLAYIVKNLFSNSQGQFLKLEKKTL